MLMSLSFVQICGKLQKSVVYRNRSKSRLFMRKSIFLLILLQIVLLGQAQHQVWNLNNPTVNMFREMPAAGRMAAGVSDSTLRVRELALNPAIREAGRIEVNDTLLLELFSDRLYRATVSEVDLDINQTLTVTAKLENQPFGYCVITTNSGKSLVTIDVPEKNELYQSRYNPQTGRYFLTQIDKTKQVALEGAPAIEPDSAGRRPPEKPGMSPGNPVMPITQDETTQDVVTLMIVYTPAAASWAAGSEGGIENTIAQLMAKARLALSNSKTLMTLQLVHSQQVQYTEQNSVNDLYNLAYTNDAYMTDIYSMRMNHCADLVVLLENISYTGGQGFLLTSVAGRPDNGFSLTRVQQASWTYTTIHEIGHNMGAHHHKLQNTQPGPGIFTYSAGWRWVTAGNTRLCTVMTYEAGSNFSDGLTHTRVGYFSDPDIDYQGLPTGDAVDANNALTLRLTKSAVAAYRSGCCTMPEVQASALTASNITTQSMTLSWTRGSGTEGVLVIARARGAVSAAPVCGLGYSADPEFRKGRQISPGNYVIYNGKGSSVDLTGLFEQTLYHFALFEYNSEGLCYLTPALTGQFATRCGSMTPPDIRSVIQPTCSQPTGSITLGGLPASGTWQLVRTPGGVVITGSGSTTILTSLNPGSYTFNVTDENGCTSEESTPVTLFPPSDRPDAPVIESIIQPSCTEETGTINLNGLPGSGTWVLTMLPGDISRQGTGRQLSLSGLTAGTYTFRVSDLTGCLSDLSAAATINNPPEKSAPPALLSVIHPTCGTTTGTITLTGLPARGSWVLNPVAGGNPVAGTGTDISLSELPPGTYAYTVTNSYGCVSAPSESILIRPQPVTPVPPVIGTLTQPTCDLSTGSVVLEGLPGEGSWTVTRIPGSETVNGTGSQLTVNTLLTGSYTFTVTSENGCTSAISNPVVIGTQPLKPRAPVLLSLLQPTCTLPTGSIGLTGLPGEGAWTLTRMPGNQSVNGTGDSYTLEELPAGTWTLTVMSANGCISTASDSFTVDEPPFVPKPIVTLSSQTLRSDAVDGNQWYNQYGIIDGATAQEYTPAYNGGYYVVVSRGICMSDPSDALTITDAGIVIRVYPNPFSESLNIDILGNPETSEFSLLNSRGQTVIGGNIKDHGVIGTADLSQGIYFLRITSGNQTEIRRIIRN